MDTLNFILKEDKMEIKTCEEYVLGQLEYALKQLEDAREEIKDLKARLKSYEEVNNNGTTTTGSEV